LYKIDWKVCFLKWALVNDRMASLFLLVEDDSFTCTQNVMYQSKLLEMEADKDISNGVRPVSIRTGAPMFDGFDDSSTFMSRYAQLAVPTIFGMCIN